MRGHLRTQCRPAPDPADTIRTQKARMSKGDPPPPSSSRWDASSLHLGRLAAARSDEHLQVHLAAVEYELSAPITIESKEDIQSRTHWSESMEPFDHQVKNLITFCRRAPVALIADDVGLGKTISAGMVLSELQTRKKVRRALILCPKIMLQQWKEELESKFGIRAAACVGQDLEMFVRHQVDVVITTYESARDRMDQIRTASFDMLILDEADKLRNLHGTGESPKLATVIHRALAARIFKYVLMLSATPIQNRLWDMYSLIDCLAVAKGHANPLGTPADFVSRYLADGAATAHVLNKGTREEFRRKIQEYMVRTSRRESGLAFPERNIRTVPCQATADERRLQDLVGQALGGMNALARTSVAEALMSSPRALLAQVRNMVNRGTLPRGVLASFEAAVLASGNGCKLSVVVQLCERLRAADPASWRVVVFTRRKETVDLLCESLAARGISVASIRGDNATGSQRSIRQFRADPPSANALISTDAGAVGLNLQVCNVVVNYDLPWNPMILEQRVGRVQRLGSRFKFVEVWNLTVAGSIEDLIVARLLAKLQTITESIGDLEGILDASSYGSDDDVEEEIRELVMRALMGQDVSAAMKKAQESIAAAKRIYDEERATVEETLGSLDAMHSAGPRVPKLKPRTPRMDVRSFFERASKADGATLKVLPTGQVKVTKAGRAPFTATFDPHDPDLLGDGLGTFGGSSVLLYQEGSRHFEGLVGEWRRRDAHRVLDRVPESRDRLREALTSWAAQFDLDLTLSQADIQQEWTRFQGDVVVRATASVSHDRYETLSTLTLSHKDHRELPPVTTDHVNVPRELDLREHVPPLARFVVDEIERHPDIVEFVRFYDDRREHERKRAASANQALEIAKRFETMLAAELVGASGALYLTVDVNAVFGREGTTKQFAARLVVVALTGQVLQEPQRKSCAATGKSVPESWLGTCAVSKVSVVRHLLERSAMSGVAALPQYLGTCQVSGRRVLTSELGTSVISGKLVASDLLVSSAVSGRNALAEEMAICDFTGARVLPSEVTTSDVSGRTLRADELAASAVSGTKGHRSEFSTCEQSGDVILPTEGDTSDVSDRFVRLDLLVPSEKSPARKALRAETVICSISGKRLLSDEAVQSAVSGAWIDSDLAANSDVSKRPARPDEIVRCAASGKALLPDEAGVSAASGRTVDRRLLRTFGLSARPATEDELVKCDFSGVLLLPDEVVTSDVSQRPVRIDQVVQSSVSGKRGHKSEFLRCAVTGDWLLPMEAGRSAVSGKAARPELLVASAKAPGRQGLPDELVTCARTGARLLTDEVGTSEVSGKRVDRELLRPSDRSQKLALAEELITCQVSGAQLLPDEVAVSAVSGKICDARLLTKSTVSGRLGLAEELARYAPIDKVALVDEVAASDVSGRIWRIDDLITSPVSGKRGHRDEMVQCSVTRDWVLPSEVGKSSVSGRIARREILVASEKAAGRVGLPTEVVVCAATGKRLLQDEVLRSDVSERYVDRDLAQRSAASGRIALPSELVSCEESSVRLLPDETDVCSVTGRRVDLRLLGDSEISGKRGLTRLLARCPETGKRGFEGELVRCESTSLLVAPEAVARCAVTGQTVLRRLMIKCDVSGRWLRRDKAIRSEKWGRLGHPEAARTCAWTGARLLSDEVKACAATAIELDADLVPGGWASAPILSTTRDGMPTQVPTDPASRKVQRALEAAGFKPRGLRIVTSEREPVAAFFADCSTMFGLRKKHVVGFARLDGDGGLVGKPGVGRLESTGWDHD